MWNRQILHGRKCNKPSYFKVYLPNTTEIVTTQSFDIGTRFQGRAIKFSPPLKTFGQKSHFVVPCLK